MRSDVAAQPRQDLATTLNVPMSAGSGDDEYLHAFDHTVSPAVERFEPDLLIVSAGFDAHEDDPLAGMRVTAEGVETSKQAAWLEEQGCDRVQGYFFSRPAGPDGIPGIIAQYPMKQDRPL